MLVKIFNDTSFQMKVTRDVSIHNTLNRAADFSELADDVKCKQKCHD